MKRLALTIILSGLIAMSGCGAVLSGMGHMAYQQGKPGQAQALWMAGQSADEMERQQLSPEDKLAQDLLGVALFGFLGELP